MERFITALFLISLSISFSISYVFMFLLIFVILFKRREKLHLEKDFLLFVILYIWRAISLIANNLSIVKLKEIIDKSGYLIFANVPSDKSSLKIYIHALGMPLSAIVLAGVVERFLPTKVEVIVCSNECSFTVKEGGKFRFRVFSQRDKFTYIYKDNEIVDSILPTKSLPVRLKLKEGKYTLKNANGVFVEVPEGSKITTKERVQIWKKFHLWDDVGKFKGTFKHKLICAGFMSISSIVFAVAGIFLRRFFFIYFIFSVIGLLMTASRAYTFSMVVSLIVLIFALTRNFRFVVITGLISAPLVFMVFFSFNEFIIHSLKLRWHFWKAGMDIFISSPLWGVGYNNISYYLIPYYIQGKIDNFAHAHNTYITALAETGILGGLIVILITIYFVFKFLKLWFNERNYMALATGVSIMNLAIAGLFEYNFDNVILNLFIGFLMGISVSKLKAIKRHSR